VAHKVIEFCTSYRNKDCNDSILSDPAWIEALQLFIKWKALRWEKCNFCISYTNSSVLCVSRPPTQWFADFVFLDCLHCITYALELSVRLMITDVKMGLINSLTAHAFHKSGFWYSCILHCPSVPLLSQGREHKTFPCYSFVNSLVGMSVYVLCKLFQLWEFWVLNFICVPVHLHIGTWKTGFPAALYLLFLLYIAS